MKNLISKVALLLLCSAFALSSCSDDDSVEKKSVTIRYKIMVSANISSYTATEAIGITQLDTYIGEEMKKVNEQYGKEWLITETAETEKAAIEACDKKAIAEFKDKLSAIDAATKSIEVKFNAKKAALSSEIAADLAKYYISYTNYGGLLYKGETDLLYPDKLVMEGILVNLEAAGGRK